MNRFAFIERFRQRGGTAEKCMSWGFAGVFLALPIGISPALMCGSAALLFWVLSGAIMKARFFPGESWFWPVLPLMVLPWIGFLYASDPGDFGISYAGKTYYWLFCLAIASLSFEVLQPRRLINAFLIGLAVNACVGILQLAGVLATKEGWYSGLTRGYNTLTACLVLGILIASFYFGTATEKAKRWALFSLLALYFFHLVILEGRTGYLTLALLSPLIVKALFRKLHFWKAIVICLLISGLMLFSPIVRDRVKLSLDQIQYHLNAEPSKAWGREYTVHQDRFYYWYGAVEIFLENPLLGVGTGAYSKTLKEKRQPDDPIIAHPHNNLLYMAVSFGVVGIAVFVWFFWELLRNALKERETEAGYLVLCTALVILVNGLFNTTIVDSGTLFLLSLVAGLQRGLPKFAERRKH